MITSKTKLENNLPKGWLLIQVGDIVDKIPLTGKKLKQNAYQNKGKLPVIDQGYVFIGGYTDNEELKICSDLPLVVFGDHTKIIKYVDFNFVAGADGIKVIQPHGVFFPKLFYYFLQVVRLPEKGYARHFQFLEKSLIPLPPYHEQCQIVEKIEELFTKLDAGVEALKRIKAQLKRYRQAVLKYAFEGKLTEEWRAEHKNEVEPASVLLERIKEERKQKDKYKDIQPPDFSDLLLLPDSWIWTNLLQFSEIILGQSPPSSTYNENKIGLPFYQGKFDFGKLYPNPRIWCSIPKKIAEKGDVLISVRAPVGPTNICPAKSCIGRGLAAIRGLNGIEPLFILYLMRAFENKFSGQGTGTTFDAITSDQLKSFYIPLPPFLEQGYIVKEVERRFSTADEIEKIVDLSLIQSARLRQSILKRSFEGKLVPQDPNDEPANKLLERIKIEKVNLEKNKPKIRSRRSK